MTNSNDMDQITLFLNVNAKIEGLCADLYHYYSEVFQDDVEAAQLWKKTALEEENHKRQFELAERLSTVAKFELTADIERAFRVHNKLQYLLKHVQSNIPDIVTALSKSIAMEESLADLHMESSIKFENNSFKQMFLAMQDFDHEHIKSLKLFLSITMLPKADMGR